MDSNKMYFRHSVELAPAASEGEKLSGGFSGIAYSGNIIKEHGFISNLIIDLSTTKIAKAKTPVLRDHDQGRIAGITSLSVIDNQLKTEGKLFQSSEEGQEIMALAAEGFEWEQSIGIFDFDMEEVENEEVNGIKIEKGTVLRNGVIREVSFLSLGADISTAVEVFNHKQGVNKVMEMTKQTWMEFACACGGDKESKPEDIQAKFEADQSKIDALEKEIEMMKKAIADKEAEIAQEKSLSEEATRLGSMQAAVKTKGIKISEEKIALASKSQDATDLFLSVIGEMPVKIEKKFTEKVTLGEVKKDEGQEMDVKSLRLKAEKMVRDGEAEDFMDAISILGGH